MANLLTALMPETAATALQPKGLGTPGIGGKTALLSEGSQTDGEALSFATTLDEQLADTTAWLNLTAEGAVPAALLLPQDGKTLPLTGEPLQPATPGQDSDTEQSDASLALIGVPLLPPGLAQLEGSAGAVQALPAVVRQGVDPALSNLVKEGAAAGGDPAHAANLPAATPEPVLLPADQAGERTVQLPVADLQPLRGLVKTLQGGTDTSQSAAVPLPTVSAPTPDGLVAAGAPKLPQFAIDVPPGHPNWGDAVGDRVNWMVNNHQAGAQLRINPPHLGPLEIKVSVHNDQASITFTAHHAVTADHLEAALPRLREMLADNGLQLAQFDVRHQGSGAEAHAGGGHGAQAEGDASAAFEGREEGEAVTATTLLRGDGLVDAYA